MLENLTLDKAEVVITTCGTLMDNRISGWDYEGKKVASIIIDEAGMLSQPDALSTFQFKQFRMVFIGDNMQLRHQCSSHAASIAGLSTSVREWLASP